ncbi:peptidase A4 family-domain-containing protein [Chiua virens]|nr:peptidase A4 family-domain-containing protein [Chiua virens]
MLPFRTAWCEWFPDYSYDFPGITISAGDTIKLNVTADSTTTGTATVENLTNGQIVSTRLASSPLCGHRSGSLKITWWITTLSLWPILAPAYTPAGANILDIEQNNQVLMSVSSNS